MACPQAVRVLEENVNQRFHRADSRVVCSDIRKLQSMDVLKLQSTKANWNTKCPFHILAYIYSNLLDISMRYFIKILPYRERLDVDSQRTKKCTFHLDFRSERVENKEK